VCRVRISVQVASRVSQLPLRGRRAKPTFKAPKNEPHPSPRRLYQRHRSNREKLATSIRFPLVAPITDMCRGDLVVMIERKMAAARSFKLAVNDCLIGHMLKARPLPVVDSTMRLRSTARPNPGRQTFVPLLRRCDARLRPSRAHHPV
jgi:hypothetical protein